MKKIITLLVIAIVSIIFGVVFLRGNIGNMNASGTVTIKGSLPSGHTKVVAFYPDGEYTISSFSGGRFSINVKKSSPLVLIFLTDDNDYLGYVTLGSGIDTFPMTKTAEDVVTIDLQNLSLSNSTFSPSHNPLGDEIQLTPEERTLVAQIDDFFASQAKNPDMDNNGKVDFLEGKLFSIQILYFISGGEFGNNLTPTVFTPAKIQGYKLSFDAAGTDQPSTVIFNGPEASGISNMISEQSNVYENEIMYFSPLIQQGLPPAGEYMVTYKNIDLSFDIPNQSSAPSHIVLAVPTITLNDDGTINNISWKYMLGDESGGIDPEGIISKIEIQIDGTGTPYKNYPQQNRMYNSGWISSTTTKHMLPTQNIKWSEVTSINMVYNDVYRNHYVVFWSKNVEQARILSVESMDLVRNATGSFTFSITIKNIGNKPVTSLTVKLDPEAARNLQFGGSNISNTNPLQPGQSATLSYTPTESYFEGLLYNVEVQAQFSDKSTFIMTISVKARSE